MLMGQNTDLHLIILMPKSNNRSNTGELYFERVYYMNLGAFLGCWSQGLPWLVFFQSSLSFIIGIIIAYTFTIYAKPAIKRLFSSK